MSNKFYLHSLAGFCACGALLCPPALASVPDEVHSIIQKAAQIEYRNLTVDSLSFKLPSSWKTRPLNNGGIVFSDALFPDVVGGVYRLACNPEADCVQKEMSRIFFADFTVLKTENIATENGHTGIRIELSGRIAGVETRVTAASFPTAETGGSILLFGEIPENWFRSYEPIFEDIIKSVDSTNMI